MKFVSEHSEKIEDQKIPKGGVLVPESSFISQKAQFDLARKTVIFFQIIYALGRVGLEFGLRPQETNFKLCKHFC